MFQSKDQPQLQERMMNIVWKFVPTVLGNLISRAIGANAGRDNDNIRAERADERKERADERESRRREREGERQMRLILFAILIIVLVFMFTFIIYLVYSSNAQTSFSTATHKELENARTNKDTSKLELFFSFVFGCCVGCLFTLITVAYLYYRLIALPSPKIRNNVLVNKTPRNNNRANTDGKSGGKSTNISKRYIITME